MFLNEDSKAGTPAFGGILSLAAAPVFATMAVGQSLYGNTTICSVMGTSAFGGMAAMYALMAVFHLPPWLALIRQGRNKASPM
jgi:hypothetical protein